jgi:hypothetical protein
MFGATAVRVHEPEPPRVFGLAPLAVLERLNDRAVHACVTSPSGSGTLSRSDDSHERALIKSGARTVWMMWGARSSPGVAPIASLAPPRAEPKADPSRGARTLRRSTPAKGALLFGNPTT